MDIPTGLRKDVSYKLQVIVVAIIALALTLLVAAGPRALHPYPRPSRQLDAQCGGRSRS